MRAYYTATELGTNLTAYRSRLLSLFQELEPALNVSAQRLSDQVRAIQRCNMLDSTVLERLYSDVRNSLAIPTSSPLMEETNTIVSSNQLVRTDEVEESETITVSTQYNDLLRSTLEDAILEYRNMTPSSRPE